MLAGLSAGSLCWFEEGLTDSVPRRWTAMNCLGFLPGSHSPHYDGEPERRPVYRRLIRQRKLKPGYAADDGVALHFIGRRLARVVSSRPAARAYHLRVLRGRLEERMILPEFLGKKAY